MQILRMDAKGFAAWDKENTFSLAQKFSKI